MAKGDITKEEVAGTISVDNSSEFKHIWKKTDLVVWEEGVGGAKIELTRSSGMLEIIYPHQDVSGMSQEIQDLAAANWNTKLKASWATMKEKLEDEGKVFPS